MTSVDSIVKKVEKHFNFLYEKGFIMSNAAYVPQLNGNWDVEFKSQDCYIYIVSDRDEIILDIAPVKYNNIYNRVSLEKEIYNLSNGNVIVEPFKGNFAWGQKKQFERLSRLLEQYIDKIIEHYKNN
ncbi:MAG TPA: hypothetical protein DHW49_13345 [Anaerolineae bacterium]|nr:hypothetical protein [Anaerolineae bacterium]